jgi:hypothetical protein
LKDTIDIRKSTINSTISPYPFIIIKQAPVHFTTTPDWKGSPNSGAQYVTLQQNIGLAQQNGFGLAFFQ